MANHSRRLGVRDDRRTHSNAGATSLIISVPHARLKGARTGGYINEKPPRRGRRAGLRYNERWMSNG